MYRCKERRALTGLGTILKARIALARTAPEDPMDTVTTVTIAVTATSTMAPGTVIGRHITDAAAPVAAESRAGKRRLPARRRTTYD